MDQKQARWGTFLGGLISGISSAAVLAGLLAYLLDANGIVSVSVSHAVKIQSILYWVYDNLRLSVVPFALVLALYAYTLGRLRRQLSAPATLEAILQTERWVDILISLFFGIGVIWTAIGMRSALLYALNDLDQATAAKLGAFEILRRLVDGGILLALSTTIVGAIGGYLMRVGKTLTVGTHLQNFYNETARTESATFEQRLENIERDVARIAGRDQQDARLGEAREISHS